jgi:prevent-host-death family protein
MARVPEIIPISDLRQRAADVLRKVRDSDEPLVITQRGRPAAVMLSVHAYEQAEKERDLLLLLARGDKEMAAGDGVELAEVLAEADNLLEEDVQ